MADNLPFIFDTAVQKHQAGALDDAERGYRYLLERTPDHVEASTNLGMLLRGSGRLTESIEVLRRAVRQRPHEARMYNELALTLLGLHCLDEAESAFREVLAHDPTLSEAHRNLGTLLMKQGRYEEALDTFLDLARREPQAAKVHDSLGLSLFALDRFAEAIDAFQRALEIDAGHAPAWCHLGDVYRADEEFDRARDCYETALRHRADYPLAHWNLAMNWLAQGDFAKGWPQYEWRARVGVAKRPPVTLPEWRGESLVDKTVLVYGEQGVGDEIMFASCLPELIGRAAQVVLICEPRLASLFARSFPQISVHGTRVPDAALPSGDGMADLWVAAGSLPQHLWACKTASPGHGAYLEADAARQAEWRARYAALGEGLKVGISWRGGKAEMVRRRRSTALDQWARILRRDDVQVVNLQYGDCAAEREAAQRAHGLVISDWDDSDPLGDLDDLAAKVAALDLVVSVDNATVHLAAALGRPVWALLPKPADWRWMAARVDSPWYSSVRLFRQPRPGDWGAVFASVADRLDAACRAAADGRAP